VTTLLAVPNVSEGRDQLALQAIADALGPGLIHLSSDLDHHRAVFTLAGRPGELHAAVLAAARTVLERVDLTAHHGVHPRVGALDVAPIVYLRAVDRGAAAAEALVLADELGELGIPVFLYGDLGGGRTRAELRRGGPAELQRRIDAGELEPDFGPPALHPTAGATLVAARPPLIAFNVEIDAPLAAAKEIAARLRQELPGVKALGLHLQQAGTVQVSTNIEDHTRVTAADVVAAVRRHAAVVAAELVAPAPRAALRDFPKDVPLRGPEPLEDQLPS
jgi:glutamate formiminotransferase / 5-formyltetrahydrofolate cyclo-ligase